MFEIVSNMLVDFAKLLPYIVPTVLVINICASLLWGDK